MADSQYPNNLDDDAQIPRVDDNITEIGGEAINSLRSAVFNIEEALGINPQGSASDVSSRLNQSLNADGTIKAAALTSIGLVTLPITNSMVGSSAGIKESKLDLDYTTKSLRELIGALRIEHDALVLTVQADITNLSRHVDHPGIFGRHYTGDIDGYVGKYLGYSLQGIINDLDTRIISHIDDTADAHDASAISFVDTNTFISANEVQTAIENLDNLGFTTFIMHQDREHSNGILSSQKTYYNDTNHGTEIVSSSALNVIPKGSDNVVFVTPPSTLPLVERGDRIDITIDGVIYTRKIKSVDNDNGIVYLFTHLPVGGTSVSAVIYNDIEEETISPLGLSFVYDTFVGSSGAGTVIQMVHPNAPFVLSQGLDVRKITSTDKNIKIEWSSGNTGDLDVYQALQNVSSSPSLWTPENLVFALNKEFKTDGNMYPLIAFQYKGEIGIALDEADGYVAIKTPSGNSALDAFGFSGEEIDYSVSPRRFFADGYELSSIRKIVDATGVTDGSTVIKSINADLTSLGIGQSGIVRVKNHADAGTYVFNSSTANSITISSHIGNFATDSDVSIEIYSDYFTVPTVSVNCTLYEIFMDSYNDAYGELKSAPRVEYYPGGNSSADPHKWFDIIEVSRNFTIGTSRINYNYTTGEVKLGTPVTSPSTSTDVTNAGTAITLPTSNEAGYRFRLYAYNNVDYVDLEITDEYSISGLTADQAVDLLVHKRISEDKFIQVGQVLHRTDELKNLSDRRLFGTVGRKDIRSDYTRDYISYPRSVSRGNGIIYGCEVSGSLVVSGGEVLVDGNIFSIDRVSLGVPTGDAGTYNVFVDYNGVLRFLKDNQQLGNFYTPSTKEIILSSDKVLLAKVSVSAGGSVTSIYDLRRFVSNLDNKIDLIVASDKYENFASLKSAVNYLNGLDNTISSPRIIKIRGRIVLDESITLPADCTLEGDTFGANSIGSRIQSDGYSVILSQNDILRNITFYSETTNSSGILDVASVSHLRLENCTFQFLSQASNNVAMDFTSIDNSVIQGCYFVNVDYGIKSSSCEKTIIKDCFFNEVYTSAIYLEDANDTLIADNFISSSDHSLSALGGMIYLNGPEKVIVQGNNIISSSSGTPAGACISLQGAVKDCSIIQNFLKNETSTTGLQMGVIAVSSGSGENLIVSNNIIRKFAYDNSSSDSILVQDFSNVVVEGNIVSNANAGCNISTSQKVSISNNHFEMSVDNICLYCSGDDISIVGNTFYSTNTVQTNTLVFLNSYRTLFINNLLQTSHTVSAGSGVYMLDGTSSVDDSIITNNIFKSTGTYNEEIIRIAGTNCILSNNNLQNVSTLAADGNLIEITQSNSIEQFNKGQIYYCKPSVISGDEDSTFSGWDRSFGSSREQISSNSATAAYNISFSNNFIPIGSTITKVEIYYSSASTPGNSDFDVNFLNQDWNDAAYTSLFSTSVDGTSGSFTTTEVQSVAFSHVVLNKRYLIVLSMTASNAVIVRGIRITYTL